MYPNQNPQYQPNPQSGSPNPPSGQDSGRPQNPYVNPYSESQKQSVINPKKSLESKLKIIVAILSVLTAAFASLFVWQFIEHSDLVSKNEREITDRAAEKEKEFRDALGEEYEEWKSKDVDRYVGPGTYGSISFEHPKYWSVAIVEDAKTYDAYFDPGEVNMSSENDTHVIHVHIEDGSAEEMSENYAGLLEDGILQMNLVSTNEGKSSIRVYKGSEDYESEKKVGFAIFNIRDKMVRIETGELNKFETYFDGVINTLKFDI